MTITVIATSQLKESSPVSIRSTPLLEAQNIRSLLLNLNTGQAVPPCKMSVTVLYYVIEGHGTIRVESEQAELDAGSLVIVPAEATRSIAAVECMRILAVQAL